MPGTGWKELGLRESEVRQALIFAEEERARDAARVSDLAALRSRMQGRHCDRLLRPLRDSSRADFDSIQRLRLQAYDEMRELLPAHRDRLIRKSHSVAKELQRQDEKWRQSRQRLAQHNKPAPDFNFNYIIIDTPGLVLPTEGLDLVEYHAAPWNNVAKISAEWHSPYPQNGIDSLTYVFAWRNPREEYAFINVDTYLGLNGFCDVSAPPGMSYNTVEILVKLEVIQWWNQPPSTPPRDWKQFANVVLLNAGGGGPFGLGDVESAEIGGNYDVGYRMLAIPPKAVGLFNVKLIVQHAVQDEGFVEVDFASGEFSVMCPGVVLGILN